MAERISIRPDEVGDGKRARDGDDIILVDAQAAPEPGRVLAVFLRRLLLMACIPCRTHCDHYKFARRVLTVPLSGHPFAGIPMNGAKNPLVKL